jgi:hypothetical protein
MRFAGATIVATGVRRTAQAARGGRMQKERGRLSKMVLVVSFMYPAHGYRCTWCVKRKS